MLLRETIIEAFSNCALIGLLCTTMIFFLCVLGDSYLNFSPIIDS